MFYLAMLVLSVCAASLSCYSGNTEAALAWSSSCCWLILLIGETNQNKDEDN